MIPLAVTDSRGSAKHGTFRLSLPPVRHVGILVRPGDATALARALDELLAAPARRERLGPTARARVERDFELGRCTRRLRRTLEAAYG